MYLLIGVIALLVAFGKSGQQANQAGAVQLIGQTPVGAAALWLLAIGLAGLALWRLIEAVSGRQPGVTGSDTAKLALRLLAGFKALMYGFLAYGVLKAALGTGGPSSSNKQTVDLTAKAMQHTGGRAIVIIVGLVLIGAGVYLAYQAWRRKFLDQMNMAQLTRSQRKLVETLGVVGGLSRGVVFAAIGIFAVVAGVQAQPGKAKGLDSALRTFAHTPLGPWLLVLVAAGLIMFGLFSCCEAKWRRL
jgi:hypothetical protein